MEITFYGNQHYNIMSQVLTELYFLFFFIIYFLNACLAFFFIDLIFVICFDVTICY